MGLYLALFEINIQLQENADNFQVLRLSVSLRCVCTYTAPQSFFSGSWGWFCCYTHHEPCSSASLLLTFTNHRFPCSLKATSWATLLFTKCLKMGSYLSKRAFFFPIVTIKVEVKTKQMSIILPGATVVDFKKKMCRLLPSSVTLPVWKMLGRGPLPESCHADSCC